MHSDPLHYGLRFEVSYLNNPTYRWTVRVALGGVTLLTLWAVFVTVARIFNLVVAGVQPEVWVLTAMMTAPFTIGAVCTLVIGTALVEKVLRRRRSATV